jgi:hypothetical protein
MKPTSEQTRHAVLSAVPFLPEDVLTCNSFFRYSTSLTERADDVAAPHPAVADPSSAYGCVDWYMYPDSKAEKVTA